MKNWNLVVTAVPGPRHVHDLLAGLRRFGHFATTSFKDVIIGEVQDPAALFEAVTQARARSEPWAMVLGRAIPIETRFWFTPDTLVAQLCTAAEALLDRLAGGSFHVRLERRGHVGELASPAIERAVADHLFTLAEARGIRIRTDFHDPDNVLVAETLGDECGVGLIGRELRTRYPFVHTR